MDLTEDIGSPVAPPRRVTFGAEVEEADEDVEGEESERRRQRNLFIASSDPVNLSAQFLSALQNAVHDGLEDECIKKQLLPVYEEVKNHKVRQKQKSMGGGEDFPKGESHAATFTERWVETVNDPDTWAANHFRDSLKTNVGNEFNTIAYDVINLIPDSDWMEFARSALKVDENTEQTIKENGNCTRDTKYKMIRHWQKTMTKMGQDASARKLFDLAVDFLKAKGSISRIIQQNFNGPITCQTLNAYKRE